MFTYAVYGKIPESSMMMIEHAYEDVSERQCRDACHNRSPVDDSVGVVPSHGCCIPSSSWTSLPLPTLFPGGPVGLVWSSVSVFSWSAGSDVVVAARISPLELVAHTSSLDRREYQELRFSRRSAAHRVLMT